jgi:hypothetical protein
MGGRQALAVGPGRGDHQESATDEAYLGSCRLVGAQLDGVRLPDARLVGIDLSEASLVGAVLTKADLRQANLVGATLVRASYWTLTCVERRSIRPTQGSPLEWERRAFLERGRHLAGRLARELGPATG